MDTALTLSPSELSVLITALGAYRSDYEGSQQYDDDAETVDDLVEKLKHARDGEAR